MGGLAHSAINQYKEYIGKGVAVEVGCSVPSSISSSQWFGEYFNKEKIEYHGYDIEENVISKLQKYFSNHDYVNFHTKNWKDGFLELTSPIAFAHLDAFDYIPPGMEDSAMIQRQTPQYKARGMELTNENSENFHLELAQWVHERSSEKCLLLFDDTYKIEETKTFARLIQKGKAKGHTYNNGWFGKGRTAVPWLESQGWKLLPKIDWPRDDWAIMARS